MLTRVQDPKLPATEARKQKETTTTSGEDRRGHQRGSQPGDRDWSSQHARQNEVPREVPGPRNEVINCTLILRKIKSQWLLSLRLPSMTFTPHWATIMLISLIRALGRS